jgi:hypothetical protein
MGLLMLINGMVKDVTKIKYSPFFLEEILTMTYRKEKKNFNLNFVNVKE